MAKTISYGTDVRGWTSFHSYEPEWMAKLGSEFFTFKNGNIYKHDVNQNRTQFYGDNYGCSVTFSSNQEPSTVKVFKNLKLETNNNEWYAELSSEMELGEIGSSGNYKFVDKEGMKYGYIRRLAYDTLNFNELSITGLGNIVSVDIPTLTITFSATIPNQISSNNADGIGGDTLYTGSNTQIGVIDSINGASMTLSSFVNTPIVGQFAFAAKNPQAESYGLRGFHSIITLKNNSLGFVELFASNAEVFKSYM